MAKYHPNKEISRAIEYALERGWRFVKSKKGHAFGQIFCSFGQRGGCRKSIWSTPANPTKHAMEIRQVVNQCQH